MLGHQMMEISYNKKSLDIGTELYWLVFGPKVGELSIILFRLSTNYQNVRFTQKNIPCR